MSEPGFEEYFGAALIVCAILWIWDYISSIFFPGQAALNLTILSFFVWLEAGFIGAYGLTRKMGNQIDKGLKVGVAAFLVNMAFRLIVFDFNQALHGWIIYLVSLLIGGTLGGLFAKKISER